MLFHSRAIVQLVPLKIIHLKWYRPVPPVADAVNLMVVPEACGLAALPVRLVIRIEPDVGVGDCTGDVGVEVETGGAAVVLAVDPPTLNGTDKLNVPTSNVDVESRAQIATR